MSETKEVRRIRVEEVITNDEGRIRKDIGDIMSLAADICENGLIQPIVVNKKLELVAGGRRLEAVKKAREEEVDVVVVDIDDDKKIKYEIFENLNRKDFTNAELVSCGEYLEAMLPHGDVESLPPHSKSGKTRDKVGEMLGISGKQYDKMKFIVENKNLLEDQEYEKWDKGKLSTHRVYTLIQARMEGKQPEQEMETTNKKRKSKEQRVRKFLQDVASDKSSAENSTTYYAALEELLKWCNAELGHDMYDGIHTLDRSA